MLILAIDTSTRGCSVSLTNETGVVSVYELFTDKSSSAMLTTLIAGCVENAGYTLSDLDAVAVAMGPGSYTGLRVGVSTAKGLCYALDKPLLAINTLEAMALQLAPFYPGHLLCPMIDARRMEVYAAVFNDQNEPVLPTQATILAENSFEDLLQINKMVFFGDGAAKFKSLVADQPNALFPSADIYPSSKTIALLAVKAFDAGKFEDVAAFEPYYLKDFMSPAPRKSKTLA
ncbi:tRNA (adenosine(37)-N6)-threonylcarbamoyltransferase complex dimerization subunit type 1 TsaB [Dyadobacter crusticola]|uniref:tRNA (adenosine(37)-N6)-threonylcarbamoyltransferase complex dimerization subunit type 1 TsaB n=1 Tax=Dyadobacter crusticola TaxID=292407 RepID=UPI0004E0DA98|nr:tRNA (adenosine(37)-N6)-threonylcarbamoyltransferase complex dimerization subunit type 1 TsaB [Dyadobacter crusticola]